MKKVVLMALVALMSLALIVPVFADFDGFTPIKKDQGTSGDKVLHVSYDEIKPGIGINQDADKTAYPEVASGTTEVTLWGWAACTDTISGFSYAINGGSVTKVAKYGATEQPVIDAGESVGASDTSRFEIKVPVTEGTQVIRAYVEFEDDTHELFWAMELTVGDATDYNDAGDTYTEGTAPVEPGDDNTDPGTEPGDTTEPGDDTNTPGDTTTPATGDVSVIFAVAAAGIVLTVLLKKRVNA